MQRGPGFPRGLAHHGGRRQTQAEHESVEACQGNIEYSIARRGHPKVAPQEARHDASAALSARAGRDPVSQAVDRARQRPEIVPGDRSSQSRAQRAFPALPQKRANRARDDEDERETRHSLHRAAVEQLRLRRRALLRRNQACIHCFVSVEVTLRMSWMNPTTAPKISPARYSHFVCSHLSRSNPKISPIRTAAGRMNPISE